MQEAKKALNDTTNAGLQHSNIGALEGSLSEEDFHLKRRYVGN